jgi:hypothetical protein
MMHSHDFENELHEFSNQNLVWYDEQGLYINEFACQYCLWNSEMFHLIIY